jgi:tripartite-type tricarboxylate transporter receptor subunit TctC
MYPQRVTLALVTVALAVALPAHSQSYPAKPVRIVVPYAPGGPLDDVARVMGQRLTEIWGQAVVIDNRGGAGGNIGAEVVVRAPADGYTLLLGNAGPITVNPSLQRKMPYDAQKDLVPVTMVLASPMVLVVHPSLPVRSVKDLVQFAKARPGQLNYASAGIGNLQHLGMESLQTMAGIRMNHVPYKGAAPAFIDLISGQVALMFANIVGVLRQVTAGRVRAIAVSSAKRAAVLPDVPGVAETYPAFDITAWMGLFFPAGTSREIVGKVEADAIRVLGRPDVRERFELQGAQVVAAPGAQLAEFIRKEAALYGKVGQASGIRLD